MRSGILMLAVLSLLLVLAVAFAVLYHAGVIPGSDSPTTAGSAASYSPAPLIVIMIALLARRRRQRAQRS